MDTKNYSQSELERRQRTEGTREYIGKDYIRIVEDSCKLYRIYYGFVLLLEGEAIRDFSDEYYETEAEAVEEAIWHMDQQIEEWKIDGCYHEGDDELLTYGLVEHEEEVDLEDITDNPEIVD